MKKLSLHPALTASDVIDLLFLGDCNRQVSSTSNNSVSFISFSKYYSTYFFLTFFVSFLNPKLICVRLTRHHLDHMLFSPYI